MPYDGGAAGPFVDAGPPSTACNLGAMTGFWRYSFTETAGTCGPLLESTVGMDHMRISCPALKGLPVSTFVGCQTATPELTPDKCSVRLAFSGSERSSSTQVTKVSTWQTYMTQTSATRVQGTGTVEIQISNPCRSTYNIVGVQLP